MINITFVMLNQEMGDLVRDVFETHKKYQEDFEIANGFDFGISIDNVLNMSEVSNKRYVDADVLVARSMTAYNLKHKNFDTPIVEIPIMSGDIIDTIISAKKRYGDQPMAMIGSYHTIFNAQSIAAALNIDLKEYTIEDNSREVVEHAIDLAVADRRHVIIGGINTCSFAGERGLHSVFIGGLSRESVWQAITTAKQSAIIKHLAKQQNAQLNTVLDFSTQGFIYIDKRQSITLINPVAERLIRLPAAQAVGRTAGDLFPGTSFSKMLENGSEYFDESVSLDSPGNTGIQFLFSKVQTTLNNEFIGYLVTLQNISDIQDAEYKIRNQIYLHGYVARYTFSQILGESRPIAAAKQEAQRYAVVDSNVLILGESGTGKEMFAQSIHNASRRKSGAFVAVNCAAIAESLIESEFFGYVAGAFTGASKNGKPGVFELAHNGTIFLDEISEIPLSLQGRLLRVLQEREVVRLGGDKVIPVNIRVISATNKNLRKLVMEGKFREDVYYRLNVLSLELPCLRNCRQDVKLLMEHFLQHYARKFNLQPPVLSDGASHILCNYPWYGNIRELRNVCEKITVLSNGGIISEEDMRALLGSVDVSAVQKPLASNAKPVEKTPEFSRLDVATRSAERSQILAALKTNNYNRSKAACALGICRATLYRRMVALGITVHTES